MVVFFTLEATWSHGMNCTIPKQGMMGVVERAAGQTFRDSFHDQCNLTICYLVIYIYKRRMGMLATHDWSMGVQTLLMIGPSGTSSAMPRWLVSALAGDRGWTNLPLHDDN
jgi:hypothetical protein